MSSRDTISRLQRKLVILSLTLFLADPGLGQTDGVHQIDDRPTRFLVRLQAKGLLPDALLSARPLSVYEARTFPDSVSVDDYELTDQDVEYLQFLRDPERARDENILASWFPGLYRNGVDFLSTSGEDYSLQANPLLYLSAGFARLSERVERDNTTFVYRNTRGLRLSGHVGRVFFETRLEETQHDSPEIARRWVIQRLGRVNGPVSTTEELLQANNLDYFVATGLVGYRTNHFEIRLGRDRNHWGNGTGSLTLSDFSHVYDQLQVRADVWRLQYVSLYTSLSDRNAGRTGLEIPPKFGVFHRLSVFLPSRIQVGLFESVIFTVDDVGESGSYFGFLNPVIFYRTVDGDIGSPGNVLMGVDAQWIAHPGYVLYGQLAVDEFRFSEFFRSRGWWKTTYGYQLGVRVADLVVDDLDANLEFTSIRPYMYSNKTSSLSYLHSRGVLGHAGGPNAREVTGSAEYRLSSRLRIAGLGSFTRRGLNTAEQNFGADPSVPYDENRVDQEGNPLEFGVETLQGIRQDEWLLEGKVSFDLWPGASFDLAAIYQSVKTEGEPLDRYVAPLVQFRWGLPYKHVRY